MSIEKSIKITSDKIIENTISNFESNSENDDDGNGGDSSNADNQKKNTLSVGVIVGIVIGILALIELVLIGLFCWKRSHKSDNPSAGHEMASEEVDERTMSVSSITSFGTMESTIITQNNSLWTNAQSDDDDPFRADSDEDIMSHII
ncbi:hypothetical protein TRFO_26859 [Tritrichomonas foetus]|uniref:Mid2 domain-containing protein n=1 Tax=Tritrichomonas foetus TaxID=1144522 RepID=A0A1J4K6W4_9EUKA|nr:hypothetical protein TRFO_26859 [Tritrichomonas foetus]|eukprot:OHT05436.1 hypothetical protein TRFO_26859 [Tritrichomonas foetus]